MQDRQKNRGTNGPEAPTASVDEHARGTSLRARTDEIELIISGLTTFALFALPGWLLDRFADFYPHMSVGLAVGADISLMVISGLSYTLAACFLAHLLTRAYWVGLIGLKAVFPDGIDWNRTPGIGPLQRDYYQRHLPDLASAIERADRLAATLFSIIGLIALAVLWVGFVLALAVVAGGLIGSRYGATNAAIQWTALGVMVVMVGLPFLTWLIDTILSRRFRDRAGLRKLVEALTRTYSVLYPQRLILPVQLTLQSNTRPLLFVAVVVFGMIGLIHIGQLNWAVFRSFTVTGEYRYLTSDEVQAGMRSSHYEDQRVSKDRVRLFPMVSSMQQAGAFVPLFLPYHPLRDNIMLDSLCPDHERLSGADCLSRLWQVELNGQPVAARYIGSERLDLGLRGLTTFVSTQGLQPGVHRLNVTWNPSAAASDAPPDDRLSHARVTYSIPFLFAPDYELQLDDEGRAPEATDP
jgi:hypothetical protein